MKLDVIRMTGGLGNQMFQYALYLKLTSMGKKVKFDDFTEYEGRTNARPIHLWCFGLEYPKVTRKEYEKITDSRMNITSRAKRYLFGRKSKEYHEKDCNFDPEVLTKSKAYLTGYFQSEKYFADIKDQVRRAFTFDEKVIEKQKYCYIATHDKYTNAIFDDYKKEIEESLAISMHLRRGDYVEQADIYGGNCTDFYYARAVTVMVEKYPDAHFFVFSGDTYYAKKWVNKIFSSGRVVKGCNAERFTIVEGAFEDSGYLDMYLMSKCKHHIIANSSFSWWGSWLSDNPDKTIIAPDNWENTQKFEDIYTDQMIRVDALGTVKTQESK